ncbi:hypothetical protein A2U01_0062903, partial [Trifolium medium]|nr:hypothetical protein [Trifolium medium]
ISGEACGLNEALNLIDRLQLHKVIIETDSLTLVQAVEANKSIRRSWGVVVQRCIDFLRRNPSSSVKWIRREQNCVAHQLARWAEVEQNRDWAYSVPDCIIPLIQKDLGFCNPL